MKLELDVEQGRELLSVIAQRVAQEAGLSDEDRASVRRWFSEEMRPKDEGMRALTAKINADLERALRTKERSQIQRHDWV